MTNMDSNERALLMSGICRYASELLNPRQSSAMRKQDRRALVEVAMTLAVEAGDDVEAWLAEILDRQQP
jgi:hypothetical protein